MGCGSSSALTVDRSPVTAVDQSQYCQDTQAGGTGQPDPVSGRDGIDKGNAFQQEFREKRRNACVAEPLQPRGNQPKRTGGR